MLGDGKKTYYRRVVYKVRLRLVPSAFDSRGERSGGRCRVMMGRDEVFNRSGNCKSTTGSVAHQGRAEVAGKNAEHAS